MRHAFLILSLLAAGQIFAASKNKAHKKADLQTEVKTAENFCAKYEGKLVAFYSDVWEVKGCKRILLSSDEVYRFTNSGRSVVDIPAAVVRGIKEGTRSALLKKRSCSELEGKYVSLDFDEIWQVSGCKKRKFPDWMTYSRNRGGLDKESPILELTWEEFNSIKDGKDFASVYDGEIEAKTRDTDIIPLNEACHGIEGKYVFFYSRVYRIEKCSRRQIDPEKFSREFPDVSPKELTAEQWISLPLGKPL